MAEDAEDTTFVVEMIVENVVRVQEGLTLRFLNLTHVGGRSAQIIIAAIGSPIVKLSYSQRSIALAATDSAIAMTLNTAARSNPQRRYL